MVELRNKGRWRKKLWIPLGCAIAAGLILTLLHEREPRYAGDTLRPMGFPLELAGGDPDRIPLAPDAIKHIGTNALPFLIKWIQYEERPWRTRLNALCSKLPEKLADRFSYFFDGRLVMRRDGAFSALYVLGPDAAPAIPTLTQLVQTQPTTINESLVVLAHIGGSGLSPVLAVLTNAASRLDRHVAINALTVLDTKALDQSLTSILTNCLNDPNRELAFCAAQILCRHDSEKELAMKTLVDGLQAGSLTVRREAVTQLKISLRFGYSVPALVQFLQDTNSPLSPYAAGALMDLADDGAKLPETVLPALTNSLHDPRPLVRTYAASAVGQFREAAEPAAPALLDLWNDPNSSVRESATNAFFALPVYSVLRNFAQWDIGLSEEQVEMYQRRYGIPSHKSALTKLLNDPDIRVREIATNAYRMIRGSNVVNQTNENASHQP